MQLPHERNHVLATWFLIFFAAISIALLWANANFTYFIKGSGESHSIYLSAHNVKDLRTLIVQDMAASPDPEAHPYWYIHHPNLPAKVLSFAWQRFGLSLEAQVGIMLALNVAGLAVLAAAVQPLSSAGALAAVFVALTSWGSFHFNAGDLLRGTHYLMVWPLLFALIRNTKLTEYRWNILVSIVSVLAVLSDWAFAGFIVAMIYLSVAIGRGRIPWRWLLRWCLIPSAIALTYYLYAIIDTVGWEFFLLDAKVTFFGRLGSGGKVDLAAVLPVFQQNRVMMWGDSAGVIYKLTDFLEGVFVNSFHDTGPICLFLAPVVVVCVVRVCASIGWGWVKWGFAFVLTYATSIGWLPLQVLLLPWSLLALRASKFMRVQSSSEHLSVLLFAVFWALLLPAILFPSYAIGFLYSGGRAPMPILAILSASLLVKLLASISPIDGHDNHLLKKSKDQFNYLPLIWLVTAFVLLLLVSSPHTIELSIFSLIVAVIASAIYSSSSVGLRIKFKPNSLNYEASSSYVTDQLAAFLVIWGITIITGVVLTNNFSWEVVIGCAGLLALLGLLSLVPRPNRWLTTIAFLVGVIFLISYKSSRPVFFGLYSGTLISIISLWVLAATMAVFVSLYTQKDATLLLRALILQLLKKFDQYRELLLITRLSRAKKIRYPNMWLMIVMASQIGWFYNFVNKSPAVNPPYAEVLSQPKYQGKSFVSTTYDGLVWYYTRGWVYMLPTNPPIGTPLSNRFLHLADWPNVEKYGKPDYFLCDATRFSFLKPGEVLNGYIEKESFGKFFEKWTCEDVSRLLESQGHQGEVVTPKYAIIKLTNMSK